MKENIFILRLRLQGNMSPENSKIYIKITLKNLTMGKCTTKGINLNGIRIIFENIETRDDFDKTKS